ncbi:MAG: glucose-6-phosphate dehydrogenase [Phycisphaerae bacterium]|nr:glucose-6-phosphate dehydrogenase [Phycisphaerae bacterium]MDD5380086.1 glucose-6-phosphate dehydrogenase [Phycisphaerae bacterium]
MKKIQPSLDRQDIICAETPAPPSAMVVFGASGDLSRRKLLVSIFQLFAQDLLDEKFYLLGCGRKKLTDEDFRKTAQQAIRETRTDAAAKDINAFTEKLYYVDGDYEDSAFYENIKARLISLNKKHKIDCCHIFYLAVPPILYSPIVEHLGLSNLSCRHQPDCEQRARLVVEKPFGRDLQSSAELNDKIRRCFDESQIYRIDHYLGKETVQNILMFRFANTIFEPVWNCNYIDHVQISIAESMGVEHRGSYYDKAGTLRDIFQNHMLQMLALVAMEPPISFEADCVRDEKVKLLRSIRPFNPEGLDSSIIRGQYGPGLINGAQVAGYRTELGIDPQSKTETFVAAKLFVDNLRWNGVPFYLRTGKRLAHKNTEISVTFKKVPHSMFVSAGMDDMPPNVLVLRIQPEEGISLQFQAKRPGSKICMSTLNMNFDYKSIFLIDMPEAYQRLLLDCMVGDQTLFNRYDSVEEAWRLLMPILQARQNDDSAPYEYPAGAESFPQADKLIESDGRKWRKLAEI